MMRAALAAPLALLAVGSPAASQGTFQPPAGCTAFVTVQSASCSVAHHFACAADPEGWKRRVDMDLSGYALTDLIDEQTQWMEVTFFPEGQTETLAPANPDPADFDTLLATGLDTYDFSTNSADYGSTRYQGFDRLTGETVTIDGVALERTEFEMTAFDAAGAELWSRRGQGFISREWRLFFGGMQSTTSSGQTTSYDDSPVAFIRPGEEGFLSTVPRHGCGDLLSGLGSWEGINHG